MIWTKAEAISPIRMILIVHVALILNLINHLYRLLLFVRLRILRFNVINICLVFELIQVLLGQHLLEAWARMVHRR